MTGTATDLPKAIYFRILSGAPEYGWWDLRLYGHGAEFRHGEFPIAASAVYDPVFDLIDWLTAICEDRPAGIEIDEEGTYVGLTAEPAADNWVALRVWEKDAGQDGRRPWTGQVEKPVLLHAFHHALLALLASAEYAPDHWGKAPEDVDYWAMLRDRLAASPLAAHLRKCRDEGHPL